MKKSPIDRIIEDLPKISRLELDLVLDETVRELVRHAKRKTRNQLIQAVKDYRDTSKNAAGKKELSALLKALDRKPFSL